MQSFAQRNLPKILLVIDMQTGFNASYHQETQAAVRRLIKAGAEMNYLILIVEFGLEETGNACGKTHATLLESLHGLARPERWDIIKKAWTDGSAEVGKYLEQRGIADAAFLICGTSTHGCVQDTVTGLSAKLPDSLFSVCKEACWQDFGNDWASFPSAKNVFLVDNAEEYFFE